MCMFVGGEEYRFISISGGSTVGVNTVCMRALGRV